MNFLMGFDRGSVCVDGGFLVGGPGKTEKEVFLGLCVGGLRGASGCGSSSGRGGGRGSSGSSVLLL